MRGAPAKFLFDDDFGKAGNGKPSFATAEHTAKLKEAEATAYARGFSEAQAAARADAQANAAAALQRIAAALETLHRGLPAIETRLETEAVEVAVAVARKLAPALVAREPFAEIGALATECFRHLVASPHVVVRVNDALHAAARDELDALVKRCGLDSRLVVMAEADIAPGDCRIEWADGGITRDSAATAAAIEHAVARYLGALQTRATIPDIPWR